MGRTLGAFVLAIVAAAGCTADRESDAPPPDGPNGAAAEQPPESVSLTETVAGVREVIDGYRGLIPGGVVLVRQGTRHRVLTWGFADTAHRTRITLESTLALMSGGPLREFARPGRLSAERQHAPVPAGLSLA